MVRTASDQETGKERLQTRVLLPLSRLPIQDIQDIQRPQVAKGMVSGAYSYYKPVHQLPNPVVDFSLHLILCILLFHD